MLSERLKNTIKDYPDFPKKDIIFKDISPIIANPELFSDLIDKIVKYSFFKDADAIIAIDARGFIFGSPIAKIVKKPLIMARKKNKLPGLVLEKSYGLEYSQDILTIQEDAILPFKKFVIVDDLLATGGTVQCVIDMLKKKNKKILALSVIIELGFLEGAKSLDIPIYSEVKY
ncbi:adenine phosphoribosyltransferase [Prochlorococcus marinus XMU1419]|uniref:adenine phosphoribosyltransferase n=1 Tax=Prochlorococcus marinus TaxID=1219 RepID=UPI001ADA2179|nr:adenine phosphoribosyltransferase [Prochlorococcus marinus]MBO8234264.1 adenine phosphoribosyltransferase [Prochlorococcus marinus XMU1419]MBW3075954.1 adenine phosphoribosyltransferase [Prochlorococcus marinus str. XMU1419]